MRRNDVAYDTNPVRELGEHCEFLQWGLGQSPTRQTIWCISDLKRSALVTIILHIFIRRKSTYGSKISSGRQLSFICSISLPDFRAIVKLNTTSSYYVAIAN